LEAYINFDITPGTRFGNQKVAFKEAYLKNAANPEHTRIFSIGDSIEIFFLLKFNNPNETNVKASIELKAVDGARLANMIDVDSDFQVSAQSESAWYSVVMHDVRLYPGTYFLSLYAGDMSSTEVYDYFEDCFSFEIIDGGKLTTRSLPKSAGLFFFTPQWQLCSQ
jgi:lipopolysaccharide transport system ATP-binding protein